MVLVVTSENEWKVRDKSLALAAFVKSSRRPFLGGGSLGAPSGSGKPMGALFGENNANHRGSFWKVSRETWR